MIGIEQYAYSSKVSTVKTEIKLLFSGLPLILCLFYGSNLFCIVTISVMILANLFLGGIHLKIIFKQYLIPIVFLITGVASVMMNQAEALNSSMLFSVNVLGTSYGCSFDSINFGLNLFLKALATVSCLFFFSLNTPFNSFLTFLRKVKFSKIIVELMELTYRFIFVIKEEAGKIYHAQLSRLGYQGYINSIHSMGELVTTVFIRAFRRVDRVNISLEARGFDGHFTFIMEEEKSSIGFICWTCLLSVFSIGIVICERLIR